LCFSSLVVVFWYIRLECFVKYSSFLCLKPCGSLYLTVKYSSLTLVLYLHSAQVHLMCGASHIVACLICYTAPQKLVPCEGARSCFKNWLDILTFNWWWALCETTAEIIFYFSENMACSALLFSVPSYLLYTRLLVCPSIPWSFIAVSIRKIYSGSSLGDHMSPVMWLS
jgi:hypothetical protein